MAPTLFTLTCPHCQRAHGVTPGHVQDWWDNHVLVCGLGRADQVAAAQGGALGRLSESLRLFGAFLLQRFNADLDLVEVRAMPNIITTAGKGLIATRLTNATAAVADYNAIGAGTGDEAAGDTALGSELARAQGTISVYNSVTSRCTYTFAAGTGTGAVTEAGRLNAASVGTLLCRKKFDVVNKGALDSLAVTHDVTVS